MCAICVSGIGINIHAVRSNSRDCDWFTVFANFVSVVCSGVIRYGVVEIVDVVSYNVVITWL